MKTPIIHPDAYIAPNATVVGNVRIGAGSSVFFGSVLRGDREPITIGDATNIQDNCVLHEEFGHPVSVGSRVTVGHGAILHSCTIGDETLIGMGAGILTGAVLGGKKITTLFSGCRKSRRFFRQQKSTPRVLFCFASSSIMIHQPRQQQRRQQPQQLIQHHGQRCQ